MRVPGAPHLSVFTVEDTSLQVVWRNLGAGELRLDTASGGPVVTEVDGGPGGGAGAVVLHGLPPDTEIEVHASGSALGGSTTLRARTLPRLWGPELTRVATVSDLHLGATTFGRYGTIVEDPPGGVHHPTRCSEAALDEAVDWGAAAVVTKGDVTHHGQVDEWREYTRLVAASPVPVLGVPGNHDRAFAPGRGLSPEDAAAAFGLEVASPLLVRDLPGLRLVLVDSTTGRRNRGRLGNQLEPVVEAVADAPTDFAALVLLHHQLHQHPFAEGWPVGISRTESVRFLDRLAETGTPTVVSSGHTHRHRRWEHKGVVVTQVGSTKDYPGVWAGYVVHEGGLRQTVRRISTPDCITWTDHTRRAAGGAWRWIAPGRLRSRAFAHTWPT